MADKRSPSPSITVNAFGDARKELLRVLAHHMVLIAERVSIIHDQTTRCHILDNAYCIWSGKAVFTWEIVEYDHFDDLEKDINSMVGNGPVHEVRDFGLTGPNGSRSSPFFRYGPAPSPSTPLEFLPRDTYGVAPVPGIDTANDDSLLAHVCLVCSGTLEVDGICQPCLAYTFEAPTSGDPNHLSVNLQDQTGPENWTSGNMYVTPEIDGQYNWSEFPEIEVQNTVGLSVPSSGLDLPEIPTPHACIPWQFDTLIDTLIEPSLSTSGQLPEYASGMTYFDESKFNENPQTSDDDYKAKLTSSKADARVAENERLAERRTALTVGKRRATPKLRDNIDRIRVVGSCIRCKFVSLQCTSVASKVRMSI